MPYDPQRSRHRPEPAADQPAPVDALLDADAVTATGLPDGVEVEVTDGGEVVVHTLDADVEITPSGDDVVVRTDDAFVEVRPEADEVLVRAGGEDVVVDTTPWDEVETGEVLAAELDAARRSRRVRLVVVAVVAAVLAAVAVVALGRSGQKRRS
ncbi:MAG: hypothetical protein MUE36_13435 [Acidimicrobiales bacterium]|jgi:hypothetical protein|nr:hypothetical protein [Acidimicrobiales bacterium]